LLKNFHDKIANQKPKLLANFMRKVWGQLVDYDENNFTRDHYTESEKSKTQVEQNNGTYSYICQLMELEGKELVLKYQEKYWEPLWQARKNAGSKNDTAK
jgi:hypothetical protein